VPHSRRLALDFLKRGLDVNNNNIIIDHSQIDIRKIRHFWHILNKRGLLGRREERDMTTTKKRRRTVVLLLLPLLFVLLLIISIMPPTTTTLLLAANATTTSTSTDDVDGVILGAFLVMHPPAAAGYAQPAVYSTSKLNLIADSSFTTNIELG
jgi:hypothetical protein